MIVPFYGYSAATGNLAAGLAGGFSFVYFKRRNADGSFVTLANPAFADDGGGAYSFEINDADLVAGSIVSYVIALGASSAQPYEVGHVPADTLSINVVPMFLFSAATGAPVAGFSPTIALYKRRNVDGTVTDLIGSAPTILDCGNELYVFLVDPSTRPTGTVIEYVIDGTVSSTPRYLDGVVEEGGQVGVFSPPNPVAPPSQVIPAIAFSASAYENQLAQLLPPGRAFDLEGGSVVRGVLAATAQELARIDARGVDLINEADPRTADETIADWEKMLSLPDDRVLAIAGTLAERRIDATAKYVSRGGQDRQFFIDLAAACGYTVEDVPLGIPAPSFGTQNTLSGALHHGVTVAYRVSAYNATGETVASAEISRVITGATNTNTQTINWSAVPGATGYKIYGRTAGAELHIVTLGAVTSYAETGVATPSGALPTGSPQPLQYPAIQKFAKLILRAGFRALDRVYGVDYAYSMLLNVQPPGGAAMAQADFERVIRHATQAHIEAVIFVYH